jgi:hypothetical protein
MTSIRSQPFVLFENAFVRAFRVVLSDFFHEPISGSVFRTWPIAHSNRTARSGEDLSRTHLIHASRQHLPLLLRGTA